MGYEWQSTASGVWQLNGGPDADGVLCAITRVERDKYLWSVDYTVKGECWGSGSAETLDAAMDAAEHAYSPLFPLRDPRSRADAARSIANAAGSGAVPTRGHTRLV